MWPVLAAICSGRCLCNSVSWALQTAWPTTLQGHIHQLADICSKPSGPHHISLLESLMETLILLGLQEILLGLRLCHWVRSHMMLWADHCAVQDSISGRAGNM